VSIAEVEGDSNRVRALATAKAGGPKAKNRSPTSAFDINKLHLRYKFGSRFCASAGILHNAVHASIMS
jgi:hypothetical protein